MNSQYPAPLVKWPGGKRQLLSTLLKMAPKKFNRYYEPFIGGGALFFALKHDNCVINDSNFQLINLYRQLQADPDAFINVITTLQNAYNQKDSLEDKEALYYRYRDAFNNEIRSKNNSVKAAALFVILNKAGFNGLYRVNSKGLFNGPWGHRETINAFDEENIKAVSALLKNTEISCGDFESSLDSAEADDFVFFDSPYFQTFQNYQAGGFTIDDHKRLSELFVKLSAKHVKCLLTNSDTQFIRDLYKDFSIRKVQVHRYINRDGTQRSGSEIIIKNY